MPFSSEQADCQPWKIMSIARRNWAIVGQPIWGSVQVLYHNHFAIGGFALGRHKDESEAVAMTNVRCSSVERDTA